MKKLQLIRSIAAALGSAGLAHPYLQRLEAEVSGGPQIQVLVAAEDVPVGATLKERALAVRDIPQAYVEEASSLLVSTRLIEHRELHRPASARMPAAGSSAPGRPVVDVQAASSLPVQIVDAPASSNSATRSPTAKKIPNDPELAAADAHVIAGRYDEARAAYALLSQRTANAATYAALARLLARAEIPACVANGKGAPKDCPGVQR